MNTPKKDAPALVSAFVESVPTFDQIVEAQALQEYKKRKRKPGLMTSIHMSKNNVDLTKDDLNDLSDLEVIHWFANAQWGSHEVIPCPHCGTIDQHYFCKRQMRWKCTACGNRFSVTSKTVFADHKLSLKTILRMAFEWTAGSSGVPALQMKRGWGGNYVNLFTFGQKLREGLARGYNVGAIAGVQEMDGMDSNGRRGYDKRGNPKDKVASDADAETEQGDKEKKKKSKSPKIPKHLMNPELDKDGQPVKSEEDPKAGLRASRPADRRLMLVMSKRGISAGTGSSTTRVAIALDESGHTVKTFAQKRASAESLMMTDEDPSYAQFAKLFAQHNTVKHSQEYSNGKGVSNNQAESFNRRFRRGIEDIYLNPSDKYLMDYACEIAWRQDVRKMSSSEKLEHLLNKALNVGHSLWWRNYTHGCNRNHEILVEGDRTIATRGKPKGFQALRPR
jgi:hypothetical protein